MELSAFEVYLVMQLDSIREYAPAGLIIGGMLFFVVGAILSLFIGTEEGLGRKGLGVVCAAIVLICTLASISAGVSISVFAPSTKTAAAMIVVPAIVNNETLQEDAGEFYDLAKDALRGALADDTNTTDKGGE